MSEPKRCDRCIYAAPDPNSVNDFAQCRIGRPKMNGELLPNPPYTATVPPNFAMWPVVRVDDFCGEFDDGEAE